MALFFTTVTVSISTEVDESKGPFQHHGVNRVIYLRWQNFEVLYDFPFLLFFSSFPPFFLISNRNPTLKKNKNKDKTRIVSWRRDSWPTTLQTGNNSKQKKL